MPRTMWPGWNCLVSTVFPTGMMRGEVRAYHGLLGLGKVVARVTVELHLTQRRDGDELLRNNLGRIKQIKPETQLIILIHNLRTQLPLRIVPILNRLKQILPNEIRVLTRDLLRLFPDHTGATLQRLPVELDKLGIAVVSDETERVHTEAVDVAEGTRDAVAGHGPEERVKGAGLLREEVPGAVVGGGGLGDFVVAAGLDGVD